MKLIQSPIAFAIIAILSACNSQQTEQPTGNNAAEAAATTREDSLYKDVIALHDEAMPKLGKIMGYEKTVQAKIDSLNTHLETRKDEIARDLRTQYEALLDQLKTAEKGMNDWMEGFDPDPKMANKEAIISYFEDQKAKAQKMKDDMFIALDSAAAKLN
jgi:hypothetical protein